MPHGELTAQHGFGYGVFEQGFDCAADGAGTILRVAAFVYQHVDDFRGDVELYLLVGQSLDEFVHLESHNLLHVFAAEHAEDDKVIEAVDEFGAELLARGLRDALFHEVVVVFIIACGAEAHAALCGGR